MLSLEQSAFRCRELAKPRHADWRRLVRYGCKVFSETDEDGLIAEIFCRIDVTDRTFVEIGVGTGMECNTVWLLMQGWSGLWIEADGRACREIASTHSLWLETRSLQLVETFVTIDNIDAVIGKTYRGEIDLLSIDIDFNDYWIWQAIEAVHPRVVVIEYNASWPPPAALTVPYAPAAKWNGTNYFGASLAALATLGTRKGYELVGCNLTGVNAFFVRRDLVGDRFLYPGSVEQHYEPPRYFLAPMHAGHPPGVGPLIAVE